MVDLAVGQVDFTLTCPVAQLDINSNLQVDFHPNKLNLGSVVRMGM